MKDSHDKSSTSAFRIPQDTYNSSGVKIDELSKKEKDEVISILKVEFPPI